MYFLANVKFRDGLLPKTKIRHERRRRLNHEKLLSAAVGVVGEKGFDLATMSEIADRADVGLGTVYYYFKSKEELFIAAMELVMDHLGRRIRRVTDTLTDPGQAYAFGCRTVMQVASRDPRWRWLLKRTDVFADTMIRVFGRYGRDDMRQAIKAGRYKVENLELVWRMTIWCLVGVSVNLCSEQWPVAEADAAIDAAVVNILCMLGMDQAGAKVAVGGLPRQLEPKGSPQRPKITKTRSPSRRNEQYGPLIPSE